MSDNDFTPTMPPIEQTREFSLLGFRFSRHQSRAIVCCLAGGLLVLFLSWGFFYEFPRQGIRVVEAVGGTTASVVPDRLAKLPDVLRDHLPTLREDRDSLVSVVSLHLSAVSHEWLSYLTLFPNLEYLELNSHQIGPGLAELSALPKLRQLHLFIFAEPRISLESVQALKHVEQVLIQGRIEGVDLSPLSELPQLRRLIVIATGDPISEQHLRDIARLPQLTSLSLSQTRDGAALRHLARLPKLTGLHLSLTTDEALEHVARVQALEGLAIESSDVSDEGVLHLAKLPRLKRLTVRSRKVTSAGGQRLQAALPQCRVEVHPQ